MQRGTVSVVSGRRARVLRADGFITGWLAISSGVSALQPGDVAYFSMTGNSGIILSRTDTSGEPSDEASVPAGGTTGQALVKVSNDDYDAGWSSLDNKADLVDGKVPASQLPSYVDDVLTYANLAAFPATGEDGKIYIDADTNLTYRWGGSAYVMISQSLALGETSATAYRGDRGKTAYDHSQLPHAPATTGGLYLSAHPIGDVVINITGINPGTLYGGTWEAFATGRMLVGVDTGQTEFNTVEKTGGEKTHTLTNTEMPVHAHMQNSHTHTQDAHNHTQNAARAYDQLTMTTVP